MDKFGLLGEKLGHSYSKEIHALFGSYAYDMYEVQKENLAEFLRTTPLKGMNVTIPYKKAVMDYCAYISPIARKMGAVNTLIRTPEGFKGYNTDYYGFREMLKKSGFDAKDKEALVLGTGGAAGTVGEVLKEEGARVYYISRNGEDNYNNLNKHEGAKLIVNATPVGMYPGNGGKIIDLGKFPGLECVLDVIYNPKRSTLIMDGEERGLKTLSGLYMLVAQAKRASELFMGSKLSDKDMERVYQKIDMAKQNIILIGMPSSGKSAVGKALATTLGREYIDIDREIELSYGQSPKDIFREKGEKEFRNIEKEIIASKAALSSKVISTGGGAVTSKDNYRLLHQNGIIIWIKRDYAGKAEEDRPLFKGESYEELKKKRYPLYESFADISVENNAAIEQTAEEIRRKLNL